MRWLRKGLIFVFFLVGAAGGWLLNIPIMHSCFAFAGWTYLALSSGILAWQTIRETKNESFAVVLTKIPFFALSLVVVGYWIATMKDNGKLVLICTAMSIMSYGASIFLVKWQTEAEKKYLLEWDLQLYLATEHGLPVPESSVIDKSLHKYKDQEGRGQIFLCQRWMKQRPRLTSIINMWLGFNVGCMSMAAFWVSVNKSVFHEDLFLIANFSSGIYFMYEALYQERSRVVQLLSELREEAHASRVARLSSS